MTTKRLLLRTILATAMVAVCGCAAGANPLEDAANHVGNVAGFWRGLWHGLIAPISFVISLFSDGVRVYEVHNNGGWYNFGFVLGVGGFTSTSAKVTRRSRRTSVTHRRAA